MGAWPPCGRLCGLLTVLAGTECGPCAGGAALKESEAEDREIQRIFFVRRDDPAAEAAARVLEQDWAARADARYDKAADLLGVAG